MQGVSKKLIDKFGNPFVLKKPDGKSYYDPELDEMVSPWKEFSGYGLMSSITAEVIGLPLSDGASDSRNGRHGV
jgi:hypothetical protein